MPEGTLLKPHWQKNQNSIFQVTQLIEVALLQNKGGGVMILIDEKIDHDSLLLPITSNMS